MVSACLRIARRRRRGEAISGREAPWPCAQLASPRAASPARKTSSAPWPTETRSLRAKALSTCSGGNARTIWFPAQKREHAYSSPCGQRAHVAVAAFEAGASRRRTNRHDTLQYHNKARCAAGLASDAHGLARRRLPPPPRAHHAIGLGAASAGTPPAPTPAASAGAAFQSSSMP